MGLVSVEWADAFMAKRLGASTAWPSDADTKEAALETAENDLAAAFGDVPDTDTGKKAVCEQALFRLVNTGADRRAALQAQGVTSAGIVQESYAQGAGYKIPVCAYARAVLGGADALYSGVLERDPDTENELV